MIAALMLIAIQDTTRLDLTDAVRRALSQYPVVAAARANLERSGAEAGEARSQRLPRLLLEGSATHFEEPMLVYPLHGLPAPGAPGSVAPAFDRTLAQGSAFLSWTVYDFGLRSARVRAAGELEQGAASALRATEQAIIARTVASYLHLLTVREVLSAQDQRLAALDAEAARVRQLLAQGKAARIEVLRIDAEAARARAERITTASQLELAERELGRLTGVRSVTAASLLRVTLRDSSEPSRDELLALSVQSSPELSEARARLAAARAALSAVRATRLPELRLQAGVVDRGRGSGDFQAEWQAGLGLSYALWTGGARASQIRRAEAEVRAAEQQMRAAELAVEQSLDRALASLREARARVAALRAAVQQSEEVSRIERTSLEVGTGTQNDYLEAEANLLRARAQLIEARNAELVARIELARVAGVLDSAWIAGNTATGRQVEGSGSH